MGKTFNQMSIKLDQSQTALQHAEKKYRSIFENAMEGIFQSSPNMGTFLTINPAMAMILGYNSSEELLAEIQDISSQLFARQRDFFFLLRQLRNQGKILNFETPFQRKDGKKIIVSVSAHQVSDEKGRLLYHEGSFVDISERKQREAAEQKQMAAELSNDAKSDFLAKVSHEIRTPLNAIMGFADILAATFNDKQQRKYIETIQISSMNLLQLINDILDLSKIEEGRMEINPAPVDLRLFFADLERFFSVTAMQKKIELGVSVAPVVPPYLNLDITRTRQILFNLIGNAVKFTSRGKVSIRATITAASSNNCVDLVITVADTGIGITENTHQSIFESFKQGRQGRDNSIEGTGIGLSISKDLIEMMGGSISVASTPGIGSTFAVTIPSVDIIAAEELETGRKEEQAQSNSKICFEPALILVADDLANNRLLVKLCLDDSPLTFIEAGDGYEAIELAVSQQPDLILMDIVMPQCSGYQALQIIRETKETKDIPAIAITAAGMKEDIEEIKRSGFGGYLIRPFSKPDLQQKVALFLPFNKANALAGKNSYLAIDTPDRDDYLQQWTCPENFSPILDLQLIPRWKQIRRQQRMPDIQAFANEIRQQAKEYNIRFLEIYGLSLFDYAEIFDIQNVTRVLDDFEQLLDLMNKNGTIKPTEVT